MTRVSLHTPGGTLDFNSEKVHDISIGLRFDGPQPNHFGADPASSNPMRNGDFVGDTRQGGSCNASEVRLNSHCNGTHTECVGHVTDERVAVTDVARNVLCVARLVSVTPVSAQQCDDDLPPVHAPDDRLISRACLAPALDNLRAGAGALVVRTLPNPHTRRSQTYRDSRDAAYFTNAAMQRVVDAGICHLLVDTPSVDRLHDGGALAAHRVLWGLPPGSRELAQARRPHATVTEMVFVANTIRDGDYALNLQIAPFVADAAPSRPFLYPLADAGGSDGLLGTGV